jgi:hypothetical protein
MDTDYVKAYYAELPSEKLIQIAREDSKDLTKEAMELLRQEFSRRNLSLDIYLPVPKVSKQEVTESSIIPGANNNADLAMVGQSYSAIQTEGTADETELTESEMLEKMNISQIEEALKKTERILVINAIIFFAGFVITAATYDYASKQGGSFFVAWGAILFGGVRAIQAWVQKRKLKAELAIKQQPQSMKSENN